MTPKAAAKLLSKTYGVNIRFVKKVWNGRADGLYHAWNNTAYISTTCSDPISVLCHEVGHALCFQRGLFPEQIGRITWKYLTAAEQIVTVRRWVRDSMCSERLADKIGAELCAKHFPNVTYDAPYRDPKRIKAHKRMLQEYLDLVEMLEFYINLKKIGKALKASR